MHSGLLRNNFVISIVTVPTMACWTPEGTRVLRVDLGLAVEAFDAGGSSQKYGHDISLTDKRCVQGADPEKIGE